MGGKKKFLVCTSTDCSGKGSAALLRDLEDLGASCGFEAQASTCLNHCGKGPNVQVSSDGKNGNVIEKVADFKAIEKLIKSEAGAEIKKTVKAVAEIKYDFRRGKGDKPTHLEKAWKLLGGSEEKAVAQEPLQASQLLVMRAREVVGSNPKSALADATKAVEMCATSGQAWVLKATACEKLNQFEEALKAAEKAIELGEVRDGTGIQRRMKQKVPDKPKEPEGKEAKDKDKKGSKEKPGDKDNKKAEEAKAKADKEKAEAEAKKKEEEKKKKQEAAKKKKEAEAKKKAEEEAAKQAAEAEAARKKQEEEEAERKRKEEEEARERAEREMREQERLKKLEEEKQREEQEREAKKKREAEEVARKAEEERQERLRREEALRKQKEEEARRAAERRAYEESFQGRMEALFGCCRSQPIDFNDKDSEVPTKVVQ
mmetsp:Transcript_89887/g.196708  ORF Transcript_89887/g.196708 Transcript_89887/m.196708 type:complete len:430 (-) Transcript_89887:40-1329(-)